MATAKVEAWGGGASGANYSDNGVNQGGGAGGGAYSRLDAFPIVNKTAYSVVVGTGGAVVASADSPGNAGNDSSFKDSTTLLAKGGSPGSAGSGAQGGGSGGASASGVGDVKFSGGNGATSGGTAQNPGAGGAGDANNGGNGTFNGAVGAGGSAGGGDGGVGSIVAAGTPGVIPGGGGGTSRNHGNSGAGADGKVVIKVALGLVLSATGGTHTTDATNDIWTFTASGTWTPTLNNAKHDMLMMFR